MICVEDALDAVSWIEDIGGLDAAGKVYENLLTLTKWVEESEWADF